MPDKPPVRHFLNRKTKIVWEVADVATLKRLLADPVTYEEVKEIKAEPPGGMTSEEPPGIIKGGKK